MKVKFYLEKVRNINIKCNTCQEITSYYAHPDNEPKIELEGEEGENSIYIGGVVLDGGIQCKCEDV